MKKVKVNYAEMLKDPRWQKKRLEVMQRDGFRCQHCLSNKKELQVHHLVYRKGANPWEYDNKDLITLCKQCHELETEEKKRSYEEFMELKSAFESKGYSYELFNSIIESLIVAVEYGDIDDESKDLAANEFFKNCICDTQNFNDIVIAGKMGLDLRELVKCNFPYMIEKYDEEVK